MTLTVETILSGTGFGPMQSVGSMQVIPLLGDDDATFAPPELEVGTRGYGNVVLRSTLDKPTIVPPGAGWVVPQRAQDHAVPSATFVKKGEEKLVDTAMCIQQTQGGYISTGKHRLSILPVALRNKALAMRHVKQFNKLWNDITAFNKALGVPEHAGNLVAFMKTYEKQLDEFVAEFELVPKQIGAVVLIGGTIVGVERAPSAEFFRTVWEPLVRVSYGSLAIERSRANSDVPITRVALELRDKTLAGLRAALAEAEAKELGVVWSVRAALRSMAITPAETVDETLDDAKLLTVASPHLSGQVVSKDRKVVFASLCESALSPAQ